MTILQQLNTLVDQLTSSENYTEKSLRKELIHQIKWYTRGMATREEAERVTDSQGRICCVIDKLTFKDEEVELVWYEFDLKRHSMRGTGDLKRYETPEECRKASLKYSKEYGCW